MLSVEELNDALTELGRRAYARGKVVEIAIYGGSALMLASNFRVTTQDVDAIADTDQKLINSLAQEIGAERGWPQDWLNDAFAPTFRPMSKVWLNIMHCSAPIRTKILRACASLCQHPNIFSP